jgi:threonine dehydrogenase-like Zn-dependent dehydrogenase
VKAIRFENGQVRLRALAEPLAVHGEVVIDVKRAGICGTDLAIISGDYKLNLPGPLTLGHEIFGELQNKAGKLPSGTRVVSEINVSCGHCYLCEKGLRTHCSNIQTIGMTRDGGFAESVSVPIENVHKVPDEVSDDEAVFTEPLAAGIQITKMCPIERGASVAIVGSGRLGLLALQVLNLSHPNLIVAICRRSGEKLELAKKYGADLTFALNDMKSDVLNALKEPTTGSSGFDHVVETTGNTSGMALALDIVRPRGTIHAKSTHGLPLTFNMTMAVVKEIRIQGSRCGPFDEALVLLKEEKISTREMVTHKIRLNEYEKAFSHASSPDEIKVILTQ